MSVEVVRRAIAMMRTDAERNGAPGQPDPFTSAVADLLEVHVDSVEKMNAPEHRRGTGSGEAPWPVVEPGERFVEVARAYLGAEQ